MLESYEEKVEKISPKHIQEAIKYISEKGDKGNHDILYVFRTPQYWAIKHEEKYVGLKDTLRVAYLYAIQDSPEDQGGCFSEKQLRKLSRYRRWTTSQIKSFLMSRGVEDFHKVEGESGDIKKVELLCQFRQIILHGPPGTGKTYSAKKMLEFLFDVSEEELRGIQGKNWDIIQFHPSYNYEDFVRGIKVETRNNQIEYKAENRILGEMCKRASDDEFNDYALIIDEINRANVSAVLGELIYALEYRGEPVDTPYTIGNSAELIVPKNLYIIGTMNNADRTIGQIDYAVRRRFAFVHCSPNDKLIMDGDIHKIFSEVAVLFNSEKHLSQDFDSTDVQVGHSYFLPDKSQEISVREQISMKIQYQVVPILREYVKDGVLLSDDATRKVIDGINASAKNLLRGPEGGRQKTSGGDKIPSLSVKQYFCWHYKDDDKRLGIGGVGRVAFAVIKDFIESNPKLQNVNEIQGELGNRVVVYVKGEEPQDPKGRPRYHEPISHNGKELLVTNQWWGSGPEDIRKKPFKKTMNSLGYSIGVCHIVNLEEGNGDSSTLTWEDCYNGEIVSGHGEERSVAIGDFKKGDLLFVRLAKSSDSGTGYIACAEVKEEKTHIAEVRRNGEEKLADSVLGNGQQYRQKYKTAFDKEYPCHAVKVKWLGRKPLNEEIDNIFTRVQGFCESKIQREDINILREKFAISNSGDTSDSDE